jgi:hypothetical protein
MLSNATASSGSSVVRFDSLLSVFLPSPLSTVSLFVFDSLKVPVFSQSLNRFNIEHDRIVGTWISDNTACTHWRLPLVDFLALRERSCPLTLGCGISTSSSVFPSDRLDDKVQRSRFPRLQGFNTLSRLNRACRSCCQQDIFSSRSPKL